MHVIIFLLADVVPTHVPEKIINNTIIIAFSIGLPLLLVMLFVIITTMLISLTVVRRRQSRGNGLYCILHCILNAATVSGNNLIDVTDHVPVDDNPAYITMKKIALNKNSAYETVNAVYETVNNN